MGRVLGGFLSLWLLASAVACTRTAPVTDTLRVLLAADLLSLDPNRSAELSTDAVLANAYEGLVTLDENLHPQPQLAESWEHPTPERWRFRLRRAQFHDGTPVTAPVVRDALLRVRDDTSLEAAQFLVQAKEISAPDDSTVEIATHEPRALLSSLALVYVAKPNSAGAFPPFLGSGPYRLVERVPGQQIRLARFDAYRGAQPEFREVLVRPIPDAGERLRLLQRGDADIAYGMTPELAERARPGFRFLHGPGLTVFYLGFDMRERPDNALSDRRVRQAFHLALDRQAIVQQALRGRGLVPSQPLTPLILGFEPDLPAPRHDPAEATRLLADAGHGKGLSLRLDFPRARNEVARVVQEQLARVGVKLALNPLPGDGVHELAKQGQSSFFMAGWSCSSGESSEFYAFCLHTPGRGLGAGNYGFYSNPRLDQIAETSGALLDARERQAVLREAARITMRELPLLPLFIEDEIFGVRDGLSVRPRTDGEIRLAEVRRVRR